MIRNFRKLYKGVYRSGRFKKNGDKTLKCHNISLVIDLRFQSEIDEHPDYIPEGVERINIPLLQKEDLGIPNDFKEFLSSKGHFYVLDTYQKIVDVPGFINRVNQVVNLILNHDYSKGNVLFHCATGKDRTGVVSAILLKRKGYSVDDIHKDYLRSNRKYFMMGILGYLVTLIKSKDKIKAKEVYRFFHVKKEYIDIYLKEI